MHDCPKAALAAAITSARRRKGISATELARRAGISPSTISRLEAAQRASADARVLLAIAKVLGVSVEQLIDPPKPRKSRAA